MKLYKLIKKDSELFNMDMSLLIVRDGKNLILKGLTENKIKNVSYYFSLNFIGFSYFYIV
jgi:hypothetical protein